MQAIKMNAEELRTFLHRTIDRHLKNVPPIELPLPVPVAGDPVSNWRVDLSPVNGTGFEDLIKVIVEETRLSVSLKAD
jgi:hypothetical protein